MAPLTTREPTLRVRVRHRRRPAIPAALQPRPTTGWLVALGVVWGSAAGVVGLIGLLYLLEH